MKAVSHLFATGVLAGAMVMAPKAAAGAQTDVPPAPGAGWWNGRPRAFQSGDLGAVFCGVKGHSNTFQQGMHVSPNGLLLTSIHEVPSDWAVEKTVSLP